MTTELTVTSGVTRVDPVALIERSGLAESTKDKYVKALSGYLETGGDLADADVVSLAGYADTLSDTGKRFLSAAVSRWADASIDLVKGSPANSVEGVASKQEQIMRLESLKSVVKPPEQKGEKTHIWLSAQQVKTLSNEIGNGIVGARDRVALGLLVAAGLRREEAVSLTWDNVKEQPYGDKVRVVLAVEGKGAKGRTVPVSATLARDLDRWADFVGREGKVLRSLGRRKEPAESMSAVALFKLVRKYALRVEAVPDNLAPHDLRRTYARVAYDSGVDIGQISRLLGHETIQTTQTYLGIETDLAVTASDFVPW